MQVIIIEGIATSGKSTLIKLLQNEFHESCNISVFTEQKTHEPIMQDTLNANLTFFESLIEEIDKNSDFVIFDRLYLTQAFRANTGLEIYAEIEEKLLPLHPVTIFLKVDEAAIAQRVSKAMDHRRTSWGDYLKTRGNSLDEIAEYYITQQRRQLELLKQSKFPYHIFDTTNHEYKKLQEK